jgi:hypothetical protein
MAIADRLLEVARSYHLEGQRCAKAKAFLAATVLEVSALEALLQAMCCMYMRDVGKTTVYRGKRFRDRRNRALEFTLSQLIDIAAELHWFPSKHATWAGMRTDLRGFAHAIREVRNYVHPGKRVRRTKPYKFSKNLYDGVCEVCDVARSWMRHHVAQQVVKRMGP